MSFHAIALLTALVFSPQAKVQIKEIKAGDGRPAQTNDVLTIEYTGTLLDGTEFDSSKGKAPYTLTLGAEEVIKGWEDGLVGMKAGGERELIIPPELAYGDAGRPPIPPKATLKFNLKLLRIDRAGDKIEIEKTIVKPGAGPAPAEGDMVDIHYLGTYLNGVKFDSSYDRKVPLHIVTGKACLIKGFSQGIDGIKEGERRRILVPSALGYGPQPRGNIRGNSTLVFEIEATKITPKAEVQKRIEADQKKLKIEEVTAGTGEGVKNGDVVSVHMVATLPDGKSLVSSRETGRPEVYQIGSEQFIRGFDIALVGMKLGGKRKVVIPAELGFGATGSVNGVVPANTAITVEIEVVKIHP